MPSLKLGITTVTARSVEPFAQARLSVAPSIRANKLGADEQRRGDDPVLHRLASVH
jgi:hypothetical protein